MYISGVTKKVFRKKKSLLSASDVGENVGQYESSSCYLNKLSQYLKCDVSTADDIFCFEINMIITLYNYYVGSNQGW